MDIEELGDNLPDPSITLDLTWLAVFFSAATVVIAYLTFRRSGQRWQGAALEKFIEDRIKLSRGESAPLPLCLAAFFSHDEGLRIRGHVERVEESLDEIKADVKGLSGRIDQLLRNGQKKG